MRSIINTLDKLLVPKNFTAYIIMITWATMIRRVNQLERHRELIASYETLKF